MNMNTFCESKSTPNHIEHDKIYKNDDHLFHRAVERIVAQKSKNITQGTGDWVNIYVCFNIAMLKDWLSYPTLYRGDTIQMIEITNPSESSINVELHFGGMMKITTYYIPPKSTIHTPLLDGSPFPISILEVGKLYLQSEFPFNLRVFYGLISIEERNKMRDKTHKYLHNERIIVVRKDGVYIE